MAAFDCARTTAKSALQEEKHGLEREHGEAVHEKNTAI